MIIGKELHKTFFVNEKKGLFKSKKKTIHAVSGLDLVIPKGQITGLLGINGAGKTTTIKMLSTLLSPTSGELTFDGLDYRHHEKIIKTKINMIAGGERMIYWRLSARENLYYFGSLYGLSGLKLKKRINYLLELTGLTQKADLPVEQYSKGMKQRLQIARGMINDPEYIFLDEPTLGLDVTIAKEMREFFDKIAHEEGKGIVLTTHYMQEVESLCDSLYLMHQGKVIEHCTPTVLMAKHGKGENPSLENAILQLTEQLEGGK